MERSFQALAQATGDFKKIALAGKSPNRIVLPFGIQPWK
jgi:hypothetical protein